MGGTTGQTMVLRFRTAREGDYKGAARCLHDRFAYTERERERDLPALWRHATASGAGLATVAHDAATGTLQWFRFGVFVADAFAAQCAVAAEPFPARRLLRGDSDVRDALLSRQDVARANRPGAGLNLLVLHSGASPQLLAKPSMPGAWGNRTLGELNWFHSGGYYLRQVLLETYGGTEAAWASDAGYQPANPYPASDGGDVATRLADDGRPTLWTATRENCTHRSGYRVADLFAYTGVPRCGFGVGERELLRHALGGDDDVTLAGTLCVSVGTIRKRWHTIYDCVADGLPGFGASYGNSIAISGGGGGERKRDIIAYIRWHCEELRPYAAAPRHIG